MYYSQTGMLKIMYTDSMPYDQTVDTKLSFRISDLKRAHTSQAVDRHDSDVTMT